MLPLQLPLSRFRPDNKLFSSTTSRWLQSLIGRCRFCLGTGTATVELSGDEKEVSRCINSNGVGPLTCTTCRGSGIQPRYLDRREFKDDD